MGQVTHHAIIATTHDLTKAQELYRFCRDIGAAVNMVTSNINKYETVFIGPDGSKSGWADSDEGDKRRAAIKERLNEYSYDDGSSPFDWVELRYSSDVDEGAETHSIVDTGFGYVRGANT